MSLLHKGSVAHSLARFLERPGKGRPGLVFFGLGVGVALGVDLGWGLAFLGLAFLASGILALALGVARFGCGGASAAAARRSSARRSFFARYEAVFCALLGVTPRSRLVYKGILYDSR